MKKEGGVMRRGEESWDGRLGKTRTADSRNKKE